MTLRYISGLAALLTVAGCAGTPDVDIGYYHPQLVLSLQATRTVGCDRQGNLYSATAVKPTASFTADTHGTMQRITVRRLDGAFSNSDLAITLRSDGRLEAINASTTGRGEEVVKAGISILSGLAVDGLGVNRSERAQREANACAVIRRFVGDDPAKVVTLTYSVAFNFANDAQPTQAFTLDGTNPSYASDLAPVLDTICVIRGAVASPQIPVVNRAPAASTVAVALREPARVEFTAVQGVGSGCEGEAVTLWRDTYLVPQLGRNYTVPIPRAALFGAQRFGLALSEGGTITKLQYAHDSGAPGLLGAANNVLTALQPDTARQQADEARAQADLIQQQQRLVRCRTNPTGCTG